MAMTLTIEVFKDDVTDDDECPWVVAELNEEDTLLNVLGRFASLFEADYYAGTYRERWLYEGGEGRK